MLLRKIVNGMTDDPMTSHPAVKSLSEKVDLTTVCGYITLLNSSHISPKLHSDGIGEEIQSDQVKKCNYTILSCAKSKKYKRCWF